jgi:transcriptional regulator with XRE-family HTH domain
MMAHTERGELSASVARRVQYERQRRNWSYEVLARHVTSAGCRMYPSTPFKIERGDPPRRITLEEFVALAKVFELSLDELLTPVELAHEARAAEVVGEIEEVLSQARTSSNQLQDLVFELAALLGADRAKYVLQTQLPSPQTDDDTGPRNRAGSAVEEKVIQLSLKGEASNEAEPPLVKFWIPVILPARQR